MPLGATRTPRPDNIGHIAVMKSQSEEVQVLLYLHLANQPLYTDSQVEYLTSRTHTCATRTTPSSFFSDPFFYQLSLSTLVSSIKHATRKISKQHCKNVTAVRSERLRPTLPTRGVEIDPLYHTRNRFYKTLSK